MKISQEEVFIINSFFKKINLNNSESIYILIIIVMLLYLIWIPDNNTNSLLYKFGLMIVYLFSILGYIHLKNSLSKSEINYWDIIIYYMLFFLILISIMSIVIEIIYRIVLKSHESIISMHYIAILKYINEIPYLIIICSIITIILLPPEMRRDLVIIKKIVFINKQLLLVITILAIFSIRLNYESISNQLSMGLLFSIYPLSFMYNIFEVISEKNIKKSENEEI